MKSMWHSGPRRILVWSLPLGCLAALIAAKRATFELHDLGEIAIAFSWGAFLGSLLALLTKAYNEKRREGFHIWGWALTLMLIGFAINTGTTRGLVLGALIGAFAGVVLGSVLYFSLSLPSKPNSR